MSKLVVNIGLMPRELGINQVETTCTLEDEIRYTPYVGQEVLIAAALSAASPPMLIATATLTQFVSTPISHVVQLQGLQFLPAEVELPASAIKATFSLLEDSMLALPQSLQSAAYFEAQEATTDFIPLDIYGEIGRQLRETRQGHCSFSGVKIRLGEGSATPIVPLNTGGEVHVRNFIFLHDEPARLFNQFAWTVGPDLEIIADARATGTEVLGTVHPSGRLVVGDDQRHWPDQDALAWHRQHFLDRLR